MSDTMRFYAACLSSYNAGHLHGVWIEASEDEDDMQEQIQAMLEKSGGEEWEIHDHEGFPFKPDGVSHIAAMAGFLADADDDGRRDAAFAALRYHCGRISEAKDMLETYQGVYDSKEKWGEEAFFENFEVPEHLSTYIDTEQWVIDQDCNGVLCELPAKDGQVHIFWGTYLGFPPLRGPLPANLTRVAAMGRRTAPTMPLVRQGWWIMALFINEYTCSRETMHLCSMKGSGKKGGVMFFYPWGLVEGAPWRYDFARCGTYPTLQGQRCKGNDCPVF